MINLHKICISCS